MRASHDSVVWDLVATREPVALRLEQVMRGSYLYLASYTILSALDEEPEGLTCGVIADRMMCKVPDTTRLLDRLEALKYIERERSKIDRRQVWVTITDAGKEGFRRLEGPLGKAIHEIESVLDEDRKNILRSILRMIRAQVMGV